MLARRHRLTAPADFRRVIRSGRKSVRTTVVLHSLSNPVKAVPSAVEGLPARVGVTVSKSVGGSVVRHRVARVIRHAVAGQLTELPAGSLWVFRALPAAGKPDASAQLVEDVRSAIAEVVAP